MDQVLVDLARVLDLQAAINAVATRCGCSTPVQQFSDGDVLAVAGAARRLVALAALRGWVAMLRLLLRAAGIGQATAQDTLAAIHADTQEWTLLHLAVASRNTRTVHSFLSTEMFPFQVWIGLNHARLLITNHVGRPEHLCLFSHMLQYTMGSNQCGLTENLSVLRSFCRWRRCWSGRAARGWSYMLERVGLEVLRPCTWPRRLVTAAPWPAASAVRTPVLSLCACLLSMGSADSLGNMMVGCSGTYWWSSSQYEPALPAVRLSDTDFYAP